MKSDCITIFHNFKFVLAKYFLRSANQKIAEKKFNEKIPHPQTAYMHIYVAEN